MYSCETSCWEAVETASGGDDGYGSAAVIVAAEAIVSASTVQSANALAKVFATGTDKSAAAGIHLLGFRL